MNISLVRRWNEVVGVNDTVYFLGDLCFKNSPVDYWMSILNGKKICIEGNHDVVRDKDGVITHHKIKGAVHNTTLEYRGYKFYLVHSPHEIPETWKGWAIHGHEHNNDISKYPFIDGEHKRINVSVEVINYRPIDINQLFDVDLSTVKRLSTIKRRVLRKEG
jgi:calcineurin-like phosphoesterase family protein